MKSIKGAFVLGLAVGLILQPANAQEFYLRPHPQTGYQGGEYPTAVSDGQLYQPSAAPTGFEYGAMEAACSHRPVGVYAGYSFAFTKLHLKESFEAQVLDFSTFTQTLVPFEYDYELTPRVWVGLRNERGLGFRTSYWNYDHESNGFQFTNATGFQIPVATSTSVIFPATVAGNSFGDTLNVSSSVQASTLDFEGTYETQLGGLNTEFGGGIRYARSDQNSEAVVIPGPIGQAAQLSWQRVFEGIGRPFRPMDQLQSAIEGYISSVVLMPRFCSERKRSEGP